MQQEGIPKFARPDQVLYTYQDKLMITSYLGGAHRCFVPESGRMGWYNYPVADLYLEAIRAILTNKMISTKHILMNVPEEIKQKLMLSNVQSNAMEYEEMLKWFKENSYCVHIAAEEAEEIHGLMLWHMNQFFRDALGIEAMYQVEENSRCLALMRINANETIANSSDGRPQQGMVGISNGKVSEFAYLLNNHESNFFDCPVIDETGFVAKVSIAVPPNFSTVAKINEGLKHYNLKLIEAVRSIGMVVFRKAA